MTEKEISRKANTHLWICVIAVALIHTALVFIGKQLAEPSLYMVYQQASVIAVAFSFTEAITVTLAWKWVASSHLDYLTTFHTASSGFRMLAVLIILGVVFAVVGRNNMIPYVVAFMVYYFLLLVLHSIFFSKMANKLYNK